MGVSLQSVKHTFSSYSHHVAAAVGIFSTLASFPEPESRADQVFFDRLMASGLRETAEGMNDIRFGTPHDAEGLERCAGFVSSLAGRTSAPFACETAAGGISKRSTARALAVLHAAASALALGGAA